MIQVFIHNMRIKHNSFSIEWEVDGTDQDDEIHQGYFSMNYQFYNSIPTSPTKEEFYGMIKSYIINELIEAYEETSITISPIETDDMKFSNTENGFSVGTTFYWIE